MRFIIVSNDVYYIYACGIGDKYSLYTIAYYTYNEYIHYIILSGKWVSTLLPESVFTVFMSYGIVIKHW